MLLSPHINLVSFYSFPKLHLECKHLLSAKIWKLHSCLPLLSSLLFVLILNFATKKKTLKSIALHRIVSLSSDWHYNWRITNCRRPCHVDPPTARRPIRMALILSLYPQEETGQFSRQFKASWLRIVHLGYQFQFQQNQFGVHELRLPLLLSPMILQPVRPHIADPPQPKRGQFGPGAKTGRSPEPATKHQGQRRICTDSIILSS